MVVHNFIKNNALFLLEVKRYCSNYFLYKLEYLEKYIYFKCVENIFLWDQILPFFEWTKQLLQLITL